MPKVLIGIVAVGASLFASGCSSIIHKPFSVDETPAKSLSLDARQRVILVTDKGGKHGSRYHQFHVVCAEPSPDMFSTIAASAGGNFNIGGKSAGLSTAMVESAAKLGPRTQTIQLLRDGLYRACEAYMNGILDWREYKAIVNSYDVVMMTTLAVDGLTSSQDFTATLGQGSAAGEGNSDTSSADATGATATSTKVKDAVSNNNAEVVRNILKDYFDFKLQLIDKMHETSVKEEAMRTKE